MKYKIMKIDYQITRLFIKPEEGEFLRPTIIAYMKKPLLYEEKCYPDGKCEGIVVEWKRKIYI